MIFDSLITTHSSITHTVSSVEKIYIEQALKILPTHVLSKIITEGWRIVVYSDVNELITIDNQLSSGTTGVTEYEMRRVFVKGIVDGRNEIAFKTTLLHELTHVFDCIIEGSYCNWKSEKYYNNEIEELITQEGSNFSEYAQSDVKEYLCTVVSRYLLNLTDFSTVPLTKAFIEKYYYMCEDSIEQRLRNLENNAVTYIELDETYNKLKYSKLNKENDKYVLQLPTSSSGGSSSGGSSDNNLIYDNNVTFSTSVSYFALNKTTISYINETLDSNTVGTWELKTIMGSTSAIAIQIRTFILNGRDSTVTDFTSLPNVQMRYFDYNNTRSWTSWVDKISTLETRVAALENNSGGSGDISSGEDDVYGKKLIASYTHTTNTVYQPTAFDPSTGIFTCPDHGLTGNEKLMINFNPLNFTTIRVIPYELFLKFDSTTWENFKPVIVDNNSFSLDGYTTFDSSKTDSIDVTKFWFETIGVDEISLNNLNLEGIKELEIVTSNTRYSTYGLCLDCLNNTVVSPYRLQQINNKIDLIPFGTEHVFSARGINLSHLSVTRIKNGYAYSTNTKSFIQIDSGKYADSWNTTNDNFSFVQLINGDLSFKNSFKIDVGTRQNIRNGFKVEIYDLGDR